MGSVDDDGTCSAMMLILLGDSRIFVRQSLLSNYSINLHAKFIAQQLSLIVNGEEKNQQPIQRIRYIPSALQFAICSWMIIIRHLVDLREYQRA